MKRILGPILLVVLVVGVVVAVYLPQPTLALARRSLFGDDCVEKEEFSSILKWLKRLKRKES